MFCFIPQDHGRGHLYRCQVVADILKENGFSTAFILEKSLVGETMRHPVIDAIPENGTMIIDTNDPGYLKRFLPMVEGLKTFWWTDLRDPELFQDVEIIAPFAVQKKAKDLHAGLELFIVPGLNGRAKRNVTHVSTIGIFFGALDETNNLFFTIYRLEQASLLDKFEFNILIGSQFEFKSFIDEHFEGSVPENLHFHYSNFESIYDFIGMNDLLIACCNNTCFEALHMGVPVVNIVQNKVQLANADNLEKKSGFPNLGLYPDLSSVAGCFSDSFFKDIPRLSAVGKKLIDGHGATRVAQKLIQGKQS
ncbi:hypothetical protein [Maridesulfovibrio sp.]|uniref:hypothetical protein n=1 Tax=Maridesulfovibrio sp. TaxID=2795000 RepID=UPI002A18AEF5|nr:hypothetical protein [Maridesulfovibrio sp.]